MEALRFGGRERMDGEGGRERRMNSFGSMSETALPPSALYRVVLIREHRSKLFCNGKQERVVVLPSLSVFCRLVPNEHTPALERSEVKGGVG